MGIECITAFAPPNVVTNNMIAERLLEELGVVNKRLEDAGQPLIMGKATDLFRTSDRWIRRYIGFSERRFGAEDVSTNDLAYFAAKLLMDRVGIAADEIDGVIFRTVTPSYLASPPDAIVLQHRLGIPVLDGVLPRELICDDGSLACSSWVAGLRLVYGLISSGQARYVLLIGADKMSTLINWQDRTFACVLADAGTATLCAAVPVEDDWFDPSYFWSWADGSRADLITTPAGGTARPIQSEADLVEYLNCLSMNGPGVKDLFVPFMSKPAIQAALRKAKLSLDEIDLVTLHEANPAQLNGPIVKAWQGQGFQGSVISADGRFGNTTTASIPLALALHPELLEVGKRFGWFSFGGGPSASFAFGQIKHPIVVATDVEPEA